jgi:uncharacterized protein YkwD
MRLAIVTVSVTSLFVLQAGLVSAAPNDATDTLAARVLDLTNSQRHQAGLGPLTLSAQLSAAAQKYSQVLASSGCFEHTCGPVPNFIDRIGQTGYSGWTSLGENIAAGYPTPEAVVGGWMASPGHRENILSPNYREIGIGIVNDSGQMGTYWTQEFGTRPGAAASASPVATDGQPPASDDGGSSGG